jgi:hypothetical protein
MQLKPKRQRLRDWLALPNNLLMFMSYPADTARYVRYTPAEVDGSDDMNMYLLSGNSKRYPSVQLLVVILALNL